MKHSPIGRDLVAWQALYFAPGFHRRVPLPSIAFSFRNLEPDSAFGAYHDLYATGADVARAEGRFYAEVQAYRFDRMILFSRRLSGLEHSRNPRRVQRDAFDHITLHLLLAGRMLAGPPGHERQIQMRPGEILVLDNSLPQQSRSFDVNVISTTVARDLIEPLVPNIRSFHGAILPESVGGLVGDFLVSLCRRSARIDAEVSARSSSAIGILLAAALRQQAPPVEALVWAGSQYLPGPHSSEPHSSEPHSSEQHSSEDENRRAQVEAFIEAHLAERDLSVDTIASRIALSRSNLYRTFAPDGGVARFVQQRRLHRVRQALRRRGETRSIATLAYAHGFASEQHFNRTFRTMFGQSPGQFRSGMDRRRHQAGTHGDAATRLAEWVCELY